MSEQSNNSQAILVSNGSPVMSDNGPPSKRQRTDTDISVNKNNSACSSESTSSTSTSLLPADVLAHVMDYLIYGDVRTCLLAGRIMAFDAAKKVSALNITRPEQLNVPAARNRFPNVEEVNVFSYFTQRAGDESGENNFGDLLLFTLCWDTAVSFVPFIQTFAKIKSVHISGAPTRHGPFRKDWPDYGRINNTYTQSNEEEQRIMSSLTLALCGAFKTGVLPQNMRFSGEVRFCYDEEFRIDFMYDCEDVDDPDCFGNCMLCRRVCKNFPIRQVLLRILNSTGYCLSNEFARLDALHFISKRPGFLENLRSNEFLLSLVHSHTWSSPFRLKDLKRFLSDNRMSTFRVVLHNRAGDLFTHLRTKFGACFENFTTKEVTDILTDYKYDEYPLQYLITKSSYEALTSLGMSIDLGIFRVVSNGSEEAVLKELSSLEKLP